MRRIKLAGRHVLITGGSAGIGLAVAKACMLQLATVTLVARTQSKLEAAQKELQELAVSKQLAVKVYIQAADVTCEEQVLAAFAAAVSSAGPIDVLVCNAGISVPGYFHDQSSKVFSSTMDLNYMGSVHAIKAVYEAMVRRNAGHICLVSSVLGTLGIIGYSSYAPTKYAIRGLADCLRNELQGTGVTVSIAFPPDTDTPGFTQESASKPLETKLISEDGSTLYSADTVANCMVAGLMRGDYMLPTPDLLLSIHARIVKALSPRNFPGVLLDMTVGFLGPVIHWIYMASIDGFSRKHAKARYSQFWGPDAGSQ